VDRTGLHCAQLPLADNPESGSRVLLPKGGDPVGRERLEAEQGENASLATPV
jgi:hypothetical protein